MYRSRWSRPLVRHPALVDYLLLLWVSLVLLLLRLSFVPPPSSADGEDTGPALVTAASTVAFQRAERSVEWATSTQVAGMLPNVATAARRLCAWLQDAGTSLAEASRLLARERRDRITQRRLLHDEIHVLRQEVCVCAGGRVCVAHSDSFACVRVLV